MKKTFVDEIETRHAWLGVMYCPKCMFGKYEIHHQIEPATTNNWWLTCPVCGHECNHMQSRKWAIEEWQREHELQC